MAIDEPAPGSSVGKRQAAARPEREADAVATRTSRASAWRLSFGIDPGKSGTVAVLDEGGEQTSEMHDMPSTLGSNGRSATNAPYLRGSSLCTHARIAFCEFVGPRPTDAKVAACGVDRAEACLIAFADMRRERRMTARTSPRSLRSGTGVFYDLEGFGGSLMKFTVYQGSRQLIDGESEGKNHVISLVQKAHYIEAILRCSRTSSAEIAEWKDEMICAVESEARNAVASIRIG